MKDHVVFLKEGISRFTETGTLFPSSKWAAEALIDPILRPKRAPMKILEVGAGTGPITKNIMDAMIDDDSLDLCELNPSMMAGLRKNVRHHPKYWKFHKVINFFEGPIQQFPENCVYDSIICALPFSNFTPELCAEIFVKLQRLGHEGTELTYFEYIGLRRISRVVYHGEAKERVEGVEKFFKGFMKNHLLDTKRIWLNLLPINVYKLKLAA